MPKVAESSRPGVQHRRMLNAEEVAHLFGTSSRWVWRRLSTDPAFPRPVRPSSRVTRWYADEIDGYLEDLRNGRPSRDCEMDGES